jgi:predicted aldo/keto reductase-like oxidoreductase
VGTVAMKPFGGGGGFLNLVWSGQVGHPSVAHLRNDSRPYEAALRWVLRDPNVDTTVPAAHSIQQIDELHRAVLADGSADDDILATMLDAMNASAADVQLRGGLAASPDAWD